MNRRLPAEAVKAISSLYLQEGRKQDSWALQWIDIDGDHLHAQVAMTSVYQPPGGAPFHLTPFSTLEFAAQLMIIYVHDWAGLREKTREAWMTESTIRAVRPILNPRDIRVTMQAGKIRRLGEQIYCVANFTVTDDSDGLFEVVLKGLLS